MSTQKSTSAKKPATIESVSKSLRIWIITFSVTAAISIVSAIAGNQSIFVTAAMVVATGMVVLRATKRDEMVQEASLVRITKD